MPSHDDIERIAAAMNAVRPAWRPASLVTFLTRHHAARPYRDLLIAGIAVASDPRTTTPNLLNEHGAWWVAAQAVVGQSSPLRADRCPVEGHTSYLASNCGACRIDGLVPDDEVVDVPRPRLPVGAPIPPDSRAAIDAALATYRTREATR